MNSTLEVKVNPFGSSETFNEPEKEQKIEFEKDELVEKTLEQYRKLKNWTPTQEDYDKKHILKLETLNPEQINTLLHYMMAESTKQKIYEGNARRLLHL